MEMSDDALIRLANFKALGHKPAELVVLIGKSYQYWRDLLAGQKSFGEKAARNIEEKLHLVRGCLDVIDGCKGGVVVQLRPPIEEGEPEHTIERGHASAQTNATLALAQTLERLDQCIDGIAPVLQGPGREALSKWALGQATIIETVATLEAFFQASSALPHMPMNLSVETSAFKTQHSKDKA